MHQIPHARKSVYAPTPFISLRFAPVRGSETPIEMLDVGVTRISAITPRPTRLAERRPVDLGSDDAWPPPRPPEVQVISMREGGTPRDDVASAVLDMRLFHRNSANEPAVVAVLAIASSYPRRR